MSYQHPYPPQYPPPFPMQPPKKSNTLVIVLSVVGGVVVLIVAACLVGTFVLGTAGGSAGSSQGDVKITSCSTTQGLQGEAGVATLEIHNSGNRQASYLITVAFVSDNGATQYDTAIASVSSLEPGQTTTQEAIGLGDSGLASKCKIVSVSKI